MWSDRSSTHTTQRAVTGGAPDGARRVALDPLRGCRPGQVWATLLDEGDYLGSESTMYRLLRAHGETGERRRQATHPPRTIPQLVATAPKEVWSYDATALKGPTGGVHYDLLVMLDIYSRYVPGWLVVDIHDGEIVKAWIDQVVAAQGGINPGTLTIHADSCDLPLSRTTLVRRGVEWSGCIKALW